MRKQKSKDDLRFKWNKVPKNHPAYANFMDDLFAFLEFQNKSPKSEYSLWIGPTLHPRGKFILLNYGSNRDRVQVLFKLRLKKIKNNLRLCFEDFFPPIRKEDVMDIQVRRSSDF